MKHLVFALSLLILVSAIEDNTLEEVKKVVEGAKGAVAEGLDKLPGDLKDKVIELLPALEPPNITEGEELLKQQCDKYGTNESFDRAMVAKEDVVFCVQGLLNFSTIEKEIEEAKPTGDLDIVFRKYCRMSGQIRQCITNFTEQVEPCLSPEQHDLKFTVGNITDSLSSFICYKEGDRIALFIAEGGPGCLKDQHAGIEQCINATFSPYLKNVSKEQENIPTFNFGEHECGDLLSLQKCVVSHLDKCSEPTPANIVDSLFKFVLRGTPCHKYTSEALTAASPGLSGATALVSVSALTLLAFSY